MKTVTKPVSCRPAGALVITKRKLLSMLRHAYDLGVRTVEETLDSSLHKNRIGRGNSWEAATDMYLKERERYVAVAAGEYATGKKKKS